MKTETKYDVDYFIRKFEMILDSNMGCGSLSSHCALYHCGVFECGGMYISTDESDSLKKILDMSLFSITELNDGYIKEYQQRTPKKRVLAKLYDIKRMQDAKKVVEEPKTEYIVVEIDRSIREQTKELVMN